MVCWYDTRNKKRLQKVLETTTNYKKQQQTTRYFDNSTHFYIVKEFIPGGDLFYHLNHFKKDKGSDESLKMRSENLL